MDLLCLCGAAGSGKSALARALSRDYGYKIVKFADPLKDMLRVLGLGDRELEGDLKELPSRILCGATPRYAMQRLGTEWGREMMGSELWVNAWKRRVEGLPVGSLVVVDDCRFPNELEAARGLGFAPLRIRREATREVRAHVSESALDGVWMPEVWNDGTLDSLVELVMAI